MSRKDNEQFVREVFEQRRAQHLEVLGHVTNDAESVMDEAKALYEEMIPDMAYVDRPNEIMAMSLFACAAGIAVYLAARKRGVDVHEFGNAYLAWRPPMTEQQQPTDTRPVDERFAPLIAAGEASQGREDTGEFVFEVFLGDRTDFDWAMNVTSCGVCHLAGKYDAMDLVPYMCATDDVVSDSRQQGLRRSGSIAVGAHQCDFRYKRGGEPRHLAAQFPDKIRLQ